MGTCSIEYDRRRSIHSTVTTGLMLGATKRPTSGGKLGAILDRLSTNILRESPETATSLAVSEEQAGGRYIDRLSDYSLEGLRRLRGFWEAALAELGGLDRASLHGQTTL
jgi:uncharacterized protein (DUF885 family)